MLIHFCSGVPSLQCRHITISIVQGPRYVLLGVVIVPHSFSLTVQESSADLLYASLGRPFYTAQTHLKVLVTVPELCNYGMTSQPRRQSLSLTHTQFTVILYYRYAAPSEYYRYAVPSEYYRYAVPSE